MTERDWGASYAKSLTVFLNGSAISEPDRRGGKITDDSFLLMFNAHYESLQFTVPTDHGEQWQVVVDTTQPVLPAPGTGLRIKAGDGVWLADRSCWSCAAPPERATGPAAARQRRTSAGAPALSPSARVGSYRDGPAGRDGGVTSAPTASYRLQLQPTFTFADAAAAVPYLAGLGISHLHLSPILQAVPGSTHGYDTVDHARVSEQLGGEDALRVLAATARAHGLGLIADVVPNHMALPVPERLNAPLWQVLRDGPDSPYARWFDIDWAAQGGRVLLPVLGDRLGAELDRLKVDQDTLRYYDHVFPLRPGTQWLPLPSCWSVSGTASPGGGWPGPS